MNLVPLRVESDGSSLLHAVSACLMGTQLFYDCLRSGLYSELTSYKAWYRQHIPFLRELDSFAFEKLYSRLLAAAKPSHGQRISQDDCLEGTHVLALANVLMRPILLLDTLSNMRKRDPSDVDGNGLYLPLRHQRTDIESRIGRCVSPLIIGMFSRSVEVSFVVYACLNSCRLDQQRAESVRRDSLS
jgi:deubiquitinating protein VCIP135